MRGITKVNWIKVSFGVTSVICICCMMPCHGPLAEQYAGLTVKEEDGGRDGGGKIGVRVGMFVVLKNKTGCLWDQMTVACHQILNVINATSFVLIHTMNEAQMSLTWTLNWEFE